jgi:hypothetical protein
MRTMKKGKKVVLRGRLSLDRNRLKVTPFSRQRVPPRAPLPWRYFVVIVFNKGGRHDP